MSDRQLKPPGTTGKDVIVSFFRATAGSIPVAGAAATEIFNWFVKAPLENRRDERMRHVGEALEELRTKRGVDLNDLQNNKGFVDAVMQATHIAMRNHQTEKRSALLNAIKNSANCDTHLLNRKGRCFGIS
jgi:hypothetical protein